MNKKERTELYSQIKETAMLEFQHGVLKLRTHDMSLLDAIAAYCDEVKLEAEDVPSLISPKLKLMLTNESKSLNLIK